MVKPEKCCNNCFFPGIRNPCTLYKERGASSGACPLIKVVQFEELNQVAKYYTTAVTEVEYGAIYVCINPVQ